MRFICFIFFVVGCAAPTAPRSFSVPVTDIIVRDYLSQAESLINASRYLEADILILKARLAAPELQSLKVAQARAFLGMGRFEEALQIINELPDQKNSRLLKARVLRAKGDLEGAIEIYKDEGELRNASDLLYILGKETEAYCLSEEALKLSNFEALESFRHARLGFAVGVNDSEELKKGKEAKFHYARGIGLLASYKIEDALLSFRAARQIGSGASEMYSDIDILEAFIKKQLFPNETGEELKELIIKRRSSLNFIPGVILVEIIQAVSN